MKSLIALSTRHIFALLFFVLCATQAQATMVKVTGWSWDTSSNYEYTYINASGGESTEDGGWAGMINYNVNGYATFGFCIDIPQYIRKRQYADKFTLLALSALTQPDGKGVVRNNLVDAAWLMDQYARSASDKKSKAALQLAIWETVYGDSFTFTGIDSATTGIPYNARFYLNALDGWDRTNNSFAANYKVLYSPAYQDQLIYYPVPEPSTLILLLAGLVGLAFIVKSRNLG